MRNPAAISAGIKTPPVSHKDLPHKPAYNIHENVRAFIFESVLDWCYRKEGVIDQKGQITPKSGRLSGKSGYLMSK
jgi:hypothetical protein